MRAWLLTGLRIRIRSDPVFLLGSGSSFQISLDPVPDPDPVFKFLWIRIRIRFQPNSETNKKKVYKSDLSEENLTFMTKDRQEMKKATISY